MEISTGTVTGRQTAVNHDGSQAVRLLQVMLTDVADVQTVQLVGQTGEESNPPVGSMVTVIAEGEAFKLAVATDDAIIPDLLVGGKRCYSTDSNGTVVMAEMRLDPSGLVTLHNGEASMTMAPDGTITVQNDNARITMSPTGAFTFHGISATFDCPVTAPSFGAVTAGGGSGAMTATTVTATTEVTANGKTLTGHQHNETGTITGVPI